MTRTEALELLSQKAREGSVTAAVMLERGLRPAPPEDADHDSEMDELYGLAPRRTYPMRKK